MSMLFAINDSPFFGRDGKFVTSRHIHDRLMKELDKNLALRVRKSEEDGKWVVSGRGVLHLSVLIETMRREGYELQVGQPQVIFKEIDGVKCEPIEELTVNVPEEYSSKIIDMVTRRKGEMVKMESAGERVNLEFNMPSRGIIGLRTNVLTASAGEAIMAHRFKEYQPHKGEIERRTNGSMIAMETGTAFAYAIDKLQDRGKFFIFPQEDVYAGQVVGEHSHDNDLVINVTKSKKLTNMRASGSDDKVRLIPPVQFSLEEALEYIKEDEYSFKIRSVNKDGYSDWSTFSVKTKSNPLEFAIKGIRGEVTAEEQEGFEISRLFDFAELGDMFHTKYRKNAMPFDMIIDLRTINQLDKFHYLSRQDGGNGTILAGDVAYSMDKENWTAVDSFRWERNGDMKVFTFKDQPKARYIKLHITEGVGNYASGRELYVFKVPGTESYLPGDINNDKKIDTNDLTSYMNYTGLRRGDSDFDYVSAGDINRNGLIDAYDISAIRN